jgi:hypothetical protein
VKKLHKALRQIAFATRRFSERGFTTPQRGGYGLQAYADALSSYFSIYSRQAVLVGDEVQQWEQFDSYSIKQLEADALCKKRTASNADLKVQRAAARQWEGFFRTVYNFVFVYTASLRKTAKADGTQWTNEERTAEAQRLYPRASLALAGGFLDDKCLITIRHPATKKSETDFRWRPPAVGHIEEDSMAWRILESWVCDPQCLSKFEYYIDNISTAMAECFFSKKLRCVP